MGSAGQLVELYWFLHAAAATAREAGLRIFSPCGSPSLHVCGWLHGREVGVAELLSDALMPAVVAVFGYYMQFVIAKVEPDARPGKARDPTHLVTPHIPRIPPQVEVQLERDYEFMGSKDGDGRLDEKLHCNLNTHPSACETLGGCSRGVVGNGATNLRASA